MKNSIGPERLDELLGEARSAGWSVNLLDPNPRKLILTFDDGRRFTTALSTVLDSHGATAIFFVCTARHLSCYPNAPEYWELTESNRRYVLERHIFWGGAHSRSHQPWTPAGDGTGAGVVRGCGKVLRMVRLRAVVLLVDRVPLTMRYAHVKRYVEAVLATVGLVVLSPVSFVNGVAIRLAGGRPILFRQVRPGLNAVPFTMYKFRTMSRAMARRP